MIAIFIPTFKRAGKLAGVVNNIVENTDGEYKTYFILEPEDAESILVCSQNGYNYILNEGMSCYADAINTAYRKTTEPYFMTGADDIEFKKGWLEAGLKAFTDGVMVVGTNDCHPANTQAKHGTHYIVKREYIEKYSGVVDMKDTVLYPYIHNWTDREFIETAKSRGVYAYAEDCLATHMHWSFGKSKMDATYEKGFKTSNQDREVFEGRKHLWEKES